MITNIYLRTMSRYNSWQNRALYEAAATLTDDARRADHGAFWGSIHGTLSHLYWADQIWLSRFNLVELPAVSGKASSTFVQDWPALVEKRSVLDDLIVTWSDGYEPGPVRGALKWFSGAAGREVEAPLGVVITHIFNHQTHHRGQAHALITAAGATTTDTDLFLMPRDLWPD